MAHRMAVQAPPRMMGMSGREAPKPLRPTAPQSLEDLMARRQQPGVQHNAGGAPQPQQQRVADKSVTLFVIPNNEASRLAYAPINRNKGLLQLVDVVNIDTPAKKPQWLKGVPAVVARGKPALYGSAAIDAMERLANVHKPAEEGSSLDLGFKSSAGSALDYTYEFEQTQELTMEEYLKRRQQQDTTRTQAPANINFQIVEGTSEDTSMESQMMARQRQDSKRAAMQN